MNGSTDCFDLILFCTLALYWAFYEANFSRKKTSISTFLGPRQRTEEDQGWIRKGGGQEDLARSLQHRGHREVRVGRQERKDGETQTAKQGVLQARQILRLTMLFYLLTLCF